ncbi:unnamed protein product, partial [Nesidiocoris tenuis]
MLQYFPASNCNTQPNTREPSITNSFSGSTSTLRSPCEPKITKDTTETASGEEDSSRSSGPKPDVGPTLQEPDVIASTKAG